MKAIILKAPKTVNFCETADPEIRDGFVKVKVAFAGICGGDVNVYNGTHPRAKPPLIMGHEMSGTIAEGHPTLPVGTPVTVNPLIMCGECLQCKTGNKHVCKTLKLYGIDRDGAMGQYMLVPTHSVVALSDKLSLKTGALVEPVAIAVHATRETDYRPGDNALIFGAGPIGLAMGLTLRAFGCTNLAIVEINKKRLEFAKNLGFDTLDPESCDIVTKVLERTQGNGADHVYDCAGHQSIADILPQVVRIKGKITIVAHYKKPPAMDFVLGMFKEFSIHFVRVYRDEDYTIAADLLAEEPAFEKLVTDVLSPQNPQKGFDKILDPTTDSVKILFDFALALPA
ncbi:MAG: alcohol dehydrogenase catalytic domain-containing protein [Oscillospiraceae bacterium]|nr:alcohol dehydrogenase catalytic domain-containing protein [Oscillospiraceae bacterium]